MYQQVQDRQYTEAVSVQKAADKAYSACIGFAKTSKK